MKPLSIITICLDSPGIEDTCNSIVSQTYTDFEWIVIDGGSNKETLDILEKHKDKMTYFISEKDNGIYHAMNKGIVQATGEYLLFLNGGDYLYAPDSLQKAFEKKPTADVIYGDIGLLHPTGFSIAFPRLPDTISDDFFLALNALHHQSTFIRRSLFEKYGLYNENYTIASDFEKWIIFFLAKCSFTHLKQVVSIFRRGGISSKKAALGEEECYQILSDFYYPSDIEWGKLRRQFLFTGIKTYKIKVCGLMVLKIKKDFEKTTFLLFGKIPIIKIKRGR